MKIVLEMFNLTTIEFLAKAYKKQNGDELMD